MSDEDIRIKLTADESGAVRAFKRLKTEVDANDAGLKQLSTQGKQTGKALKDAASVLGPEFQILGDRIDHITGALGDVKTASIATKGALAGLVAVGAFEVGKMLGDFVFQTEQWEEATKRAIDAMSASQTFLAKQSQDRFEKELQIAKLAETEEQKRAELVRIRARISQQLMDAEADHVAAMQAAQEARDNDMFGFGTQDNEVAEKGLQIAKDRVAALDEQFNRVDRLLDGERGLTAELEKRQAAADQRAKVEAEAARAAQDRMKAEEQAAANAQRLADTQNNYLDSLEAELVRIKEGEEAYLRLTLAKQGFTEETINAAIAMKSEIEALREAARAGGDRDANSPGPVRQMASSELRAQEARFITRGSGAANPQSQMLAVAKQQAAKQEELVKEQRAVRDLLNRRLPREVY